MIITEFLVYARKISLTPELTNPKPLTPWLSYRRDPTSSRVVTLRCHDLHTGVWGKLGAALVARKPGSAPFQRDRRERAGLLPRIEHETSSLQRQSVPTRATWWFASRVRTSLSTGMCAAAPVGYLETGLTAASMGRVPNGYRNSDAETALFLAAEVSSCTVLAEKNCVWAVANATAAAQAAGLIIRS
jgi:hypothetical protein